MACPLGAIGTTASRGNKLRVPLVERRIFQDKQDVAVNPELQVADGQQDTGGFRSSVVYLFEASGERGFLLVGGQLRQQQRMAYTDFIGIERFDRCRYKVGQFQPAKPRMRAICPPSPRSARCCTSGLPSPAKRGIPALLPSDEFRTLNRFSTS